MILASIMLLLVFMGGIALAAEKAAEMEILTGEVLEVDNEEQLIVIKVGDENITLNSEMKLLEGIKPGDKVTFERSEIFLKSIKKITTPAAE